MALRKRNQKKNQDKTEQAWHQVTLSVVIPAYKEEKRITRCIEESLFFFRNNARIRTFELIFVVDVSGDKTIFIIEEYAKNNPEIKLIVNQHREQKGGSVRVGMLAAKYDVLLFYDVDLSTPLYEINSSLDLLGIYDIVIGSRGLRDSHVEKKYFKKFLSYGFSLLKWLVLGLRLVDTQCGFKMFRRTALPIFQKQRIKSSLFDVEILYVAQCLGFSIAEKPITWIDSDMSNFNTLAVIFSFFREIWVIRINSWRGCYGKPK